MARQIAELSTYPLMELGDDPSTPIANDQMFEHCLKFTQSVAFIF